MQPYGYTVYWLLLGVLIGLPVLLKRSDRRYEPYPSVLLPSGSGLSTRFMDGYALDRLDAFAVRSGSSDTVSVYTELFLSIPPTHRYFVWQRLYTLPHYSPALKAWLRRHLKAGGFAPHYLSIQPLRYRIDPPDPFPSTHPLPDARSLDLH